MSVTKAHKIRLGITGCGQHSHVHAAASREVSDVDIVAACDVDKNRAEAWVEHHQGDSSYDSLAAMLKHADLDGVILCTWPNQHIEQIRLCLAHGITNILCEKALVTSAQEAKEVFQLVGKHRANLVEASVHRHQPAIRKLEQLLTSNDIGPIDCVRAAFHNFEPEASKLPSGEIDWRYRPECGGGVVYDWMHYLVDSCNHFASSPPKRVFATGKAADSGQVISRIYGVIEYENGMVGIIESSKYASFSNALQVTCAHGILHLPIAWAIQGEVTITQTRRKPEWDFVDKKKYVIPSKNAYALQLKSFCQVIRGEEPPVVPLQDSVVNAATTEALVRSLQQGNAINVNMGTILEFDSEH